MQLGPSWEPGTNLLYLLRGTMSFIPGLSPSISWADKRAKSAVLSPLNGMGCHVMLTVILLDGEGKLMMNQKIHIL